MNGMTRRMVVLAALAAGTTVLGPRPAAAQEGREMWRAWAVTEGDQTHLVIEGLYSLGGPGTVAIVEEAVPQGINPKILIVTVRTAVLPGIWAAVIQPIPASYVKSPYKRDQYASIEVRYPDGSTRTIPSIIDAESGPK